MKRTIPGIVCLLLSLPLVTACATVPSERASPEAVAVQVLTEVCLPYVADRAPLDSVTRRLDAGWSKDFPELLTSGPPGPVYRQSFAPSRGVLGFIPELLNPPYGLPRTAGCNLVLSGADTSALIAAVEAALTERRATPSDDLSEVVVARYVVTGATVRVSRYVNGRSGVTVTRDAEAQP